MSPMSGASARLNSSRVVKAFDPSLGCLVDVEATLIEETDVHRLGVA